MINMVTVAGLLIAFLFYKYCEKKVLYDNSCETDYNPLKDDESWLWRVNCPEVINDNKEREI